MFYLNICVLLVVVSIVHGEDGAETTTETPHDDKPTEAGEHPDEGKASNDEKPQDEVHTSTEHPPAEGDSNDKKPSEEEHPADEKPADGEQSTTTEEPKHSEDKASQNKTQEPSSEDDFEHKEHEIKSNWEKLPKDCGRTKYDNQPKLRIVNGDKAKLGQFPWIAQLGAMQPEGNPAFFCGGTIISEYYIVSTAHCDSEYDIIRVGENDLTSDTDCFEQTDCAPRHQDIPISRFIFQDFCRDNIDHDLMLIELENPISFNDFVQPACLPRIPINHDEFIGQTTLVAGFGLQDPVGTPAESLTYVSVTVIDPTECKYTPTPLTETQFCMGTPGVERHNGTCNGDSGGPVTKEMEIDGKMRAHLVGAISFGSYDCEPGPGVYTDISYYSEWIVEKMTKY